VPFHREIRPVVHADPRHAPSIRAVVDSVMERVAQTFAGKAAPWRAWPVSAAERTRANPPRATRHDLFRRHGFPHQGSPLHPLETPRLDRLVADHHALAARDQFRVGELLSGLCPSIAHQHAQASRLEFVPQRFRDRPMRLTLPVDDREDDVERVERGAPPEAARVALTFEQQHDETRHAAAETRHPDECIPAVDQPHGPRVAIAEIEDVRAFERPASIDFILAQFAEDMKFLRALTADLAVVARRHDRLQPEPREDADVRLAHGPIHRTGVGFRGVERVGVFHDELLGPRQSARGCEARRGTCCRTGTGPGPCPSCCSGS
jgi:hypothetical protein